MRLLEETPLRVGDDGPRIREASGVAALSGGGFVVLDDERGLFVVQRGVATAVPGSGALEDLEGVCVSADGERVYVVSERNGAVHEFTVHGAGIAPAATRTGRLPRIGRKKNGGWEGLAFAPARTLFDEAVFLGAHQRKPRRIGCVSVSDLSPLGMLRLPKAARKILGDLNDVGLDPDTGHLLVLSGKVGRVAELAYEAGKLRIVDFYKIASKQNDVPEGLTVARGCIWIVTDGQGSLRKYERPR